MSHASESFASHAQRVDVSDHSKAVAAALASQQNLIGQRENLVAHAAAKQEELDRLAADVADIDAVLADVARHLAQLTQRPDGAKKS